MPSLDEIGPSRRFLNFVNFGPVVLEKMRKMSKSKVYRQTEGQTDGQMMDARRSEKCQQRFWVFCHPLNTISKHISN